MTAPPWVSFSLPPCGLCSTGEWSWVFSLLETVWFLSNHSLNFSEKLLSFHFCNQEQQSVMCFQLTARNLHLDALPAPWNPHVHNLSIFQPERTFHPWTFFFFFFFWLLIRNHSLSHSSYYRHWNYKCIVMGIGWSTGFWHGWLNRELHRKMSICMGESQ